MTSPPTDRALKAALLRYRTWLETRAVPDRARSCFVSRLRRYLQWFQRRYNIVPLPSIVSGQAVYLYREDLYRQGLSAPYVRSLVYPARLYHQWAVQTRQLDEPPLPAMIRPPAGTKMKEPKPPQFSVPYVGREEHLAWAAHKGVGPRTLRHYRGTLSSVARWMRDTRGEVLAPKHLRPGLLSRYFHATKRSPRSYKSASFALRSYASWATEARLLNKDPYASSRRSTSLDPAERKALAHWLASQGYAPSTVRSRLTGMSGFARWFLHAHRRRLSRHIVRPNDIQAYGRWLERHSLRTGRHSLSPATASSLTRAARKYLEWTRT